MLRQSLIAAALTFATITASAGSSSAASATIGADGRTQPVLHQVVVEHRTIVHHVYRYEPIPAPYYAEPYYGYYAPAYAPAPPILAVPAAAACVALSLIGGC
jgi:hypothetical protein